MEVSYTFQDREDLAYWKKTNNQVVLKKIRQLIEAIVENPFDGIGKPEPLKHNLSGTWSRRINREHRLVYELIEDNLIILSLKGHY